MKDEKIDLFILVVFWREGFPPNVFAFFPPLANATGTKGVVTVHFTTLLLQGLSVFDIAIFQPELS